MSGAENDAERSARNGASADAPIAETGDDAVLPFQLDALDLRGRVARLDATLNRIIEQHAYPPSVCALIGEAALLTALIGQAMKLRSRFSLQARSNDADAPVSLIATDYFAPETPGAAARIRAYARFSAERTPETTAEPYALLGEGLFAMTIDPGAPLQPYQGITPLTEGGLSASAEAYFAQSEQVATRFHLAIGLLSAPGSDEAPRWRAGGVMLQHLARFGEHVDAEGVKTPEAEEAKETGSRRLMSADDVAALDGQGDAWRSAVLKLNTAEEIELVGPHVSPESLLIRLFHEDTPRVFPAQPIAFGCTCGPEKVENLLRSYPAEAVAEMATEAGEIEADCQFCGARYVFPLSDFLGDGAVSAAGGGEGEGEGGG